MRIAQTCISQQTNHGSHGVTLIKGPVTDRPLCPNRSRFINPKRLNATRIREIRAIRGGAIEARHSRGFRPTEIMSEVDPPIRTSPPTATSVHEKPSVLNSRRRTGRLGGGDGAGASRLCSHGPGVSQSPGRAGQLLQRPLYWPADRQLPARQHGLLHEPGTLLSNDRHRPSRAAPAVPLLHDSGPAGEHVPRGPAAGAFSPAFEVSSALTTSALVDKARITWGLACLRASGYERTTRPFPTG